MKRIGSPLACFTTLFATATVTATAFSSPAPTSAVINERIFNDCAGSTLVTNNSYPTSISISDDADDGCTGFANLHNWRFSEDGSNAALYANGDIFRFSAELVISGPGQAEAGLQISPWWSQNVEGRLNVRTTDGEIALFGGVLPFYSFSSNHGVFYAKGEPIKIEINYVPNSNTDTDPATLEVKLTYQGMNYTSGILPFGNCNMAEQPTYGCYGILHMAQVGGHIQALWQAGGNQQIEATWRDITYSPDAKPTPVAPSSWGRIKALYR